MIKISLTEEELKQLLNGDIVKSDEFEIILKDIGIIPIVETAFTAFLNFIEKTVKEDEDKAALALIKFQKMISRLENK